MRNDIWNEELLEQADDEIDRLRSENEDLAERIDELMDEIDELKKHDWISVKDRLPEDDREVLAVSDGCVLIANWQGEWIKYIELEDDYTILEPVNINVQYWMELPKPPDVEE